MAELMAAETDSYEQSALFSSDAAVIAEAVRAERKSTRQDRRVLHEAVRMTAIHARVHQLPPERLVRALKALVRELSRDDETEAQRVIYTDRVIAWAIESYYDLTDR
jgi:hypothetical protein